MSEALEPGTATMVGVDWRTSLTDAAARVEAARLAGQPRSGGVIGGLAGGGTRRPAVVDDGRRAIDAGAVGHVFNLGHGVLPETDPGVLTDLVSLVHSL